MTSTTNKAMAALEFINAQLSQGKTIFIATSGRITKITSATVAKWQKSGYALFIFDNEGNLRIGSGKHYNIIVTPSISLVRISAQ